MSCTWQLETLCFTACSFDRFGCCSTCISIHPVAGAVDERDWRHVLTLRSSVLNERRHKLDDRLIRERRRVEKSRECEFTAACLCASMIQVIADTRLVE